MTYERMIEEVQKCCERFFWRTKISGKGEELGTKERSLPGDCIKLDMVNLEEDRAGEKGRWMK